MFEQIIDFIRDCYNGQESIGLHEPRFDQSEIDYVSAAIKSTFVSSVGEYVNRFEEMICNATGSRFAVVSVNGTAALHIALKIVGVDQGDEVITQPLTFVATANAISYCAAHPIFLDVDREDLGLSPKSLERYLFRRCRFEGDRTINKHTGRKIAACVPMHTFGHPCQIDRIIEICNRFRIPVIEDAAEAIGSLYKGRHVGTFGRCGILSFNGNKIITCGGGGAIITNDDVLASRVKHLTTTAKVAHRYEYVHDTVGYNYRMPNLNAALGCAQLNKLDEFIEKKRQLAEAYAEFFDSIHIPFIKEPPNARSNYWLNAILFSDQSMRDRFLEMSNDAQVMTRPAWQLLNRLPMYLDCETDALETAEWLTERLVNIPSSVVIQ
jgi:aminotransferase in exopolysaccharide biosynthesis